MIFHQENYGNFYNCAGNTISLKEHSSLILWEKLVYLQKKLWIFILGLHCKSSNIEVNYAG